MTALSLAGALFITAPSLASATESPAGGPGELVMVAGHSGGHGGGHDGRGGWHRGSGDDGVVIGFDDYAGYSAYGGGCGFYRHRWHETGQHYWLRRYELCLHG